MVSVRQRSTDFFVRYAIVEADRQGVTGPLKIHYVIVTVRCGTSGTRWRSLRSHRVRHTCAMHALLPRWQPLVIGLCDVRSSVVNHVTLTLLMRL